MITLDQAAHLRDATLEMGWGGVITLDHAV